MRSAFHVHAVIDRSRSPSSRRCWMSLCVLVLLMAFAVAWMAAASEAQPLAGTEPLTMEGDLAAQMVAGIGRFLLREIEASVGRRAQHWKPDCSSPENYAKSVAPNRQRFLKRIGVVDAREKVRMELVAGFPSDEPGLVGKGRGFKILAVRWNALRGVEGEGLLLEPARKPVADVIALPDADWTPEMLVGLPAHGRAEARPGKDGVPSEAQFARRLAENGCRVLVPMLIDRQQTYSGTPGIRMTNQPHREFIYRAAFEMGRHLIGYEVQKVLAAVDWLSGEGRRIGVVGYGEGGLIAFHAAAADPRIDAAAVSGYFGPREAVWQEPIYRNVFGLLDEFGDAELAGLIAPRTLIVEACRHPEIAGPPAPSQGRAGAAPGVVTTPTVQAVEAEFQRAQKLVPNATLSLVKSGDGRGLPGTDGMLSGLLSALGVKRGLKADSRSAPKAVEDAPDRAEARLKRQFDQLVEHTQYLLREAEFRRREFWSKADESSVEKWAQSCGAYRDYLWDEVIGRFPPPSLPPRPRSRLIYDEPKFQGYEIVLDVWPDVFAYGILLLPKGMAAGERRPVVVCQHGLEGRPQDVADPKVDNPSYH
ncbi:MAG: hypothetical protein FJ279_34685, partial [Planctomycetes bacterium]|nr:hypothetical protein [Planctomycetota bacterium]